MLFLFCFFFPRPDLFSPNLGPFYALSSLISPSASQQLAIKVRSTTSNIQECCTTDLSEKTQASNLATRLIARARLSDRSLSSFMFQGGCDLAAVQLSMNMHVGFRGCSAERAGICQRRRVRLYVSVKVCGGGVHFP